MQRAQSTPETERTQRTKSAEHTDREHTVQGAWLRCMHIVE